MHTDPVCNMQVDEKKVPKLVFELTNGNRRMQGYSSEIAQAVADEVARQLADLPTAGVAGEAILRNSAVVVFEAVDQAMAWSNRFAPEHIGERSR